MQLISSVLIMEQTTLKIGDEFVTYVEFEKARKKHELTTFTNLVTVNSRKLDLGPLVSQDDVNNLRYKSVVLKCKYFGSPNSTAIQREAPNTFHLHPFFIRTSDLCE